MIPESFQFPALAAVAIALVSFIIIPAIAINDRMDIQESTLEPAGEADQTSCALPPTLDIEEGGTVPIPGPLSIDNNKGRSLETATFALG